MRYLDGLIWFLGGLLAGLRAMRRELQGGNLDDTRARMR